MQNTASPLTSGPILPLMVRLAIPNTLANILMVIPSLVEAWRLSTFGPSALAGVALVFPLYMLLMMWSAGSVGGAVSGAVARAIGAGDQERANSIARAAMVMGLGGAIIMALMVLGGGTWLFALLGGEGPVLEAAWAYALVFFGLGLIPWIYHMMGSVIRGTGNMTMPMIAVAIMTLVHVLGSGPVISAYGVSGAAGLLVFAHGIGIIVLYLFLQRPSAPIRLTAGPIDWALIRQLLGPGLLAATQSLVTIITSLTLVRFAAPFGEEVLAGYGLGARIELLMIPLIFGVGGASIAMVGAATGAGMHRRAIRIGWTAAAIAAVIVGALGIILAATAASWAPILSDNQTVASTLISYIQRVGPFYLFFALGLGLFFACQGMGTLIYPVLGAVVRLAVIVIGGLFLATSGSMTPETLFIVITLGMIAYGAFIAIMLWRGPWKERLKLEQNLP